MPMQNDFQIYVTKATWLNRSTCSVGTCQWWRMCSRLLAMPADDDANDALPISAW